MCNNLESSMRIVEVNNERIFARNFPSQNMQSYLSVRPVMTKYSILPIVDPRKGTKVPLIQQPIFNPHTTFNPGNSQSPWSGFASSVNTESELRNQIYALQKCSQSVYVPSSKSDLYQYSFQPKNNVQPQHSLLFEQDRFSDFNPKYTFSPGNRMSPWSGFASNVNVESELRNQIYALQKCSQSVYVPSSESDLYHFSMKNNIGQSNINQPFPDLFKTDLYSDFNPNSEQIAKGQFNNHTRQQLKQASD